MFHIRAAAALVWAALCLLIVALLVCAPWVVMAITPNPPRWLDAITLGKLLLLPAGVGLVWCVAHIIDVARPGQDPSDIDLTSEDQPHIHALVREASASVGVTAPTRITLTPGGEVHLRWRSGPEIAVGLTAVHILDQEELRAVLAHELAYLRPGRFSARLMAWRLHRACLRQRLVHGQVATWVLLPYMQVAGWLAQPSHRAMELDADLCAARVTSPHVARQAWTKLMAAQVAWNAVMPTLISMFDYAGARASVGDAARAVVGLPTAQRRPFDALVANRIAVHGTNPWDPRLPLRDRLASWEAGETSAKGNQRPDPTNAEPTHLSVPAVPSASLLVGDLHVAEALQLGRGWPVSTWDDVVAKGSGGTLASQAHYHLVTLLNDRVLRADTPSELLRVLTLNQTGRLVDEWFDMGVRVPDGDSAPRALAFDDDDDDHGSLTDAVGVAHTIVAAAVLHAGVGGAASWQGQAFIDVVGPDGTSLYQLVESAVADSEVATHLEAVLTQWGLDMEMPLLPLFEHAALATAPRMEGVVTGMTSDAWGAVDLYVWNHAVVALPTGSQREQLVRHFIAWQRGSRVAHSAPFGPSTPHDDTPPVPWEAMVADQRVVTLPYAQVRRAKLGWLRQRYFFETHEGTAITVQSTGESHDFGEPSLTLSTALAGQLR